MAFWKPYPKIMKTVNFSFTQTMKMLNFHEFSAGSVATWPCWNNAGILAAVKADILATKGTMHIGL